MISILYFSTKTCAPCKAFRPVVESVGREMGINVSYIDAQENSAMAQANSVTAVPTIIILKNGQTVQRFTGAIPKAQLVGTLKANS